ncbi:PaaI family thioesterase [Pontixanthobacter gangjinensis]|uniref:Hotdog fold thioesterase n=1 Tax=Pontixanthobacter gangjinensis TaxID=1028742 RepID=A0A6I4SPJ7_9SPHN|nr:PaaI family thioesterase [Pontixanthobacter gangjinensis]MXO57733.1 hotdog fold thioesterase [Pontixanthobacter gangjinensis]
MTEEAPIFTKQRSPSAKLMGSEFVSFDAETATVTVSYTPPPSFASPRGAVQGGLIGGFLDEVMGTALLAVTGGELLPLNLDLSMTFCRMVPLETITAKGRVIRSGRRVAFLEGELFDKDGNLLARATSTAIPTPVPSAGAEKQ